MSDVHIALLRGINVGGKNTLPMKKLVSYFEELGSSNVRSYIQSGNVVFRAPLARAARIASAIRARIASEHGMEIPVVVRTRDEWRKVLRGNPFLEEGIDHERDAKSLHVMFLADAPTRARIAELDAERSPPDRFVVRGANIYMHCPNGVAKTKLSNAYFDSALATTSTARNWRTVIAIGEMADSLDD